MTFGLYAKPCAALHEQEPMPGNSARHSSLLPQYSNLVSCSSTVLVNESEIDGADARFVLPVLLFVYASCSRLLASSRDAAAKACSPRLSTTLSFFGDREWADYAAETARLDDYAFSFDVIEQIAERYHYFGDSQEDGAKDFDR